MCMKVCLCMGVCVFLWVMVGMYEAKGEREAAMAWSRSRWSSVPVPLWR